MLCSNQKGSVSCAQVLYFLAEVLFFAMPARETKPVAAALDARYTCHGWLMVFGACVVKCTDEPRACPREGGVVKYSMPPEKDMPKHEKYRHGTSTSCLSGG